MWLIIALSVSDVHARQCDARAGDCFEVNATPGCADVACCEVVCVSAPFCCDNVWDEACVTVANALCTASGACCLPDQDLCIEASESECGSIMGVFFGDGSLCATVTCPLATGRCCLESRGTIACQELSLSDCSLAGGFFLGDGGLCQDEQLAYVDDDAPRNGDGASWATAFRTVVDAIEAREACDYTIRIAGGVYQPDVHAPGDREASFRLTPGMRVEGGFAGLNPLDGDRADTRDVDRYPTVFTGDLLQDDTDAFLNRAENSIHVVTMLGVTPAFPLEPWSISTVPIRLSGVTIANGEASIGGVGQQNPRLRGGGIYARLAVCEIEACAFLRNNARARGGGIYIEASSYEIIGSTFYLNRGKRGAAIDEDTKFIQELDVIPPVSAIRGCAFVENGTFDDVVNTENVVHVEREDFFFAVDPTEGTALIEDCQFENNLGSNIRYRDIRFRTVKGNELSVLGTSFAGEIPGNEQFIENFGQCVLNDVDMNALAADEKAIFNKAGAVMRVGAQGIRGLGTLLNAGRLTPGGLARDGVDATVIAPMALTLKQSGGGANGQLEFDVFVGPSGVGADFFAFTGFQQLSGAVRINVENEFDDLPIVGSVPVISGIGELDGQFDAIFSTGVGNGRLVSLSYGTTSVGLVPITIQIDAIGELVLNGIDALGIPGNASDGVTADFNGDGFDDVALALPDLGLVLVLINAGVDQQGTWLGFDAAASQQISLGGEPTSVAAGDFNQFAGVDLAVAQSDGAGLTILTNGGDGTLSFASLINVGGSIVDIATARVNEDSFDDLVMLSQADDSVRVLVGSKNLSFSAQEPIVLNAKPRSLAVAPLSGMKVDDIAVVTEEFSDEDDEMSGQVVIFGNDGRGAFAEVAARMVGQDPLDIEPSDIDEDKDLDLVLVNEASGDLSLIENIDGRTFADAYNVPVGDSPSSLALVDLDSDGDDDLVVAVATSADSRAVRVVRNDSSAGNIVFAEAFDDTSVFGSTLLLGTDIDQADGDDVIIIGAVAAGGGGTDNPLGVLLQQSCIGDCAPSGGNGVVNIDDLIALLVSFGEAGACDIASSTGPVVDGVIDTFDFMAMLNQIGACQ
ncbi:MAG: FG-GAP-like repeat-containing protein [Planctomycetota bacterium]